MVLREEQIHRYSRQILLPDVGGRGQRKLLAGELQMCGLGSVGVFCSLYLAAAGVGKLWLSDDTMVSAGDVGLAGIYQPEDVGFSREEIVQRRLTSLNSDAVCLVGASPSARAIYCGAAAAPLEHQGGLRVGVHNHHAIVQSGCLACAAVLSDGEGPLDEALAMIAGSLGAYEALYALLGNVSLVPDTQLSFEGEHIQYQRHSVFCAQPSKR
jgi:hypothetical protein